MRVDALTPVVLARPGETTSCTVRIVNDGAGDATYQLRLVGFSGTGATAPAGTGVVPERHAVDVQLALSVPEAFQPGQHAFAVEVTSNRRGEAPALTTLAITVQSLDHVLLSVSPSTVSGNRGARFTVDLENRRTDKVSVHLDGTGERAKVRFGEPDLELAPGERVRVAGTVTAPLHLAGEPRQHLFTVTVQGRSVPVYATATFEQRPLVGRPFILLLSLLTMLGLWAGAVWYGFNWMRDRNANDSAQTSGATPSTTAPDAGGDTAGGEDTAGGTGQQTETEITGVVKAGDASAGVRVSLAEISLGGTPSPGAAQVGNPGKSAGGSKLRETRYGTNRPGFTPNVRQTFSVDAVTGETGLYTIRDVAIGRTYEVNFAKEGFDSQSFVVTPQDAEPVKLEVELQPATGSLSGTTFGDGGRPLGGVDLTITDGTLNFKATSSTAGGQEQGSWSIDRVSTPGVYTVIATAPGYGTEVLQTTLEAGDTPSGVDLRLRRGVGSISGTIRIDGQPAGGITVQASAGDVTVLTTSLTQGDKGRFTFPQLPLGQDYTLTVSATGYTKQTKVVRQLSGNVADANFALVRTTASLKGHVVSDKLGPLANADIVVERNGLFIRATSADRSDVGAFNVEQLPPGTYRISFSRYDHPVVSQTVTLVAGAPPLDLGNVLLTYVERVPLDGKGKLVVKVLNAKDNPLAGAKVTVTDTASTTVVRQTTGVTEQTTFDIVDLPVGTYDVKVDVTGYRPNVKRVSIGLGEVAMSFTMFKLGKVSGQMLSGLTRQQLSGYFVTVSPEANLNILINATVDSTPGDDGLILWQTGDELQAGKYRLAVVPPVGLAVRPQVVSTGYPVMTFEVLATSDEPIRLKPFIADSFPSLKGRVTIPRTAGLQPFPGPLSVRLTCPPTTPSTVSEVPATTISTGGLYEFTREDVSTSKILGDGLKPTPGCRVTAASSGYPTSTANLLTPLSVSSGTTRSDQVVNLVIVPPTLLGGTTYWVDRGTLGWSSRDVSAKVTSASTVVTGFTPAQPTVPATDSDVNVPPTPQLVVPPDAIIAQLTAPNAWVFPAPDPTTGLPKRQVAGATDYRVAADVGFAQGRFNARLGDDERWSLTEVDPTVRATTADGRTVGVELAKPDPITLSGQVDILTVSSTPNVAGIGLLFKGPNDDARTGPSTKTVALATVPGAATGTYSMTGLPGTWRLDVAAPANHRIFASSPGSCPQAQVPPSPTFNVVRDPGTSCTGFSTTFVELGTIRVSVRDASNRSLTLPAVVTVAGPTPRTVLLPTGTSSTVITGLDPSLVSPLTVPASYTVTVAADGYISQSFELGLLAGSDLSVDAMLAAKPGSLDLTLAENRSSVPIVGVAGATVTLTPTGGGSPVVQAISLADGRVFVPNVPPGDYVLEAREVVGGLDARFPVVVTVSVPNDNAVRIVATLARVGGKIVGVVDALNNAQRSVPVPAIVSIGRTTTATPDATVTASGTSTLPTEASTLAVASTDPGCVVAVAPCPALRLTGHSTSTTSLPFQFSYLFSGIHNLAFGPADGYTAPGPQSLDVAQATKNTTATYRALDRRLLVTITPPLEAVEDLPTASLTMVDGSYTPVYRTTYSTPAGGFVFDVPPDATAYTLTIDRDLFEQVVLPVVVRPGTGQQTVLASMTGKTTSITGVVNANPTGTSTFLITATDGTTTVAEERRGNVSYVLRVAGTGSTTLTASQTGYRSSTVSVQLKPGTTVTAPVLTPTQLASALITVATPATGATVAITSPAVSPSPVVTGNTFAWRGNLEPDTTYTFRVSATGFAEQSLTFPAVPGGIFSPTVNLVACSGVTLTGAVDSGTRVDLTGPSTQSQTTSGPGYVFTGLPNGRYTLSGVKLGTGSGTANAVVDIAGGCSATGPPITLTPRQLTLNFSVTAGSTAIVSGVDVSLGGVSGTTAAGTVLTLSPLENANLTWTAGAGAYLTQSGSVALDPQPNGRTTYDVPITMVSRPSITGTLTPTSGSTPIVGAQVRYCSGPSVCPLTAAAGTVASTGYTVANLDVGTWRVTAYNSAGTVGTTSPLITVLSNGSISPTTADLQVPPG